MKLELCASMFNDVVEDKTTNRHRFKVVGNRNNTVTGDMGPLLYIAAIISISIFFFLFICYELMFC